MKLPRRFALFLRVVLVALTLGLLSPLPAFALSAKEEARVDAMLAALAKRTDLVFIRNGEKHNAADAVAHLRLKLSRTRNRLDTAEEFIDKVASSSSMSGEPYTIQQAGKPAQPAKPFLHELLKQVSP
ncbi:YfeK family protein [Uliginosibacterium sp. sgz301328]|uniref:YfeK family protein n=1 Tax=Uliginosibacterium sp. sgz301328 TaxID=3243764 RepID=UPI00359EF196